MMETREHEGFSGLAEATKVRQGGADRAAADTSIEFRFGGGDARW
jgi:hypothetical protein